MTQKQAHRPSDAPKPNEKQRYPWSQAAAIAGDLLVMLAPFCERIEIAGSIRRKKAIVGDIELLCIPRWVSPGLDMFEKLLPEINMLDKALDGPMGGWLEKRQNTKGSNVYGPSNKLMRHKATGIPVDIFSTTTENWGMALLVRTGSAEFNIRVMSRFKAIGMAGHAYGGVTDRDGAEISCETEEKVFALLGWNYIAPERRE